ncbi:nucleotidyltransferase family protein [Lactococcus taiwanensis]|uniref:nucleotidyltransferase family protein n=1 Tax=Lactococcus taiwanensis TaxID=1151742 RepID=UPI001906903F|nr:nucleotidyltransferase family protein [Lactococcus taiwanensis]
MGREKEFITLLRANNELMVILDEVATLNLPNYYIAAGSIFQTVWNQVDSKLPMHGVEDIDVVYFDDHVTADQAVSKDHALEKELSQKFPFTFDVHNEAYMHLWRGGNKKPYQSTEDAIGRWIATVHAIGITGTSKHLEFYAPYGLDDIFTKTLRPIIHKDNNKELYEKKIKSWQTRFSHLRIIAWPEK